MAKISFIIPSINRESLHKTLGSIEVWPGDEIIVEFDLPPSGGWGNTPRNKGIARATGDYLSFMDDDDKYVPGHRQIQEDVINANPGKPVLFKMQYPNGKTLWRKKEIVAGNVGSPMIMVPNDKKMLYKFFGKRNMGDFIFVYNWGWKYDEVVWSEEVIALLGHNNEELKL